MFTLTFFKENSEQNPLSKTPYWTLLGDENDLEKIPAHHREQLLFLNEKVSDFIYQYVEDLQILNKDLWQPFDHFQFQHQEKYKLSSNKKAYKKWLYQRGIPFADWILVIPNFNVHPMLMTWKMLLNYAEDIFAMSDDLLIFDFSQTWFLFHYHERETTLIKR
ncbi:hypothetical protein [Sphingobacterium bovistauri]|uniref:Uncharacterized protein n=1 Tax=Sphingobacterium bovistauri TaxID=2781959 RepID=A0ABS7Z5E6_9SPHI|nr:hypothetical protein [Sphingobacterium bovistauri]MCA5005238.1 hypothetical protein [Sphingobacterium bovistauri]